MKTKVLTLLLLGAMFSCSPEPAVAKHAQTSMAVPFAAPSDVRCYLMPGDGNPPLFVALGVSPEGFITSEPQKRALTSAEAQQTFVIHAIKKERWNAQHGKITSAVPVPCIRDPA